MWILVGGYTAEVQGEAEGIHVLRWQGSTEDRANLVAYPSVPLISPSYLLQHPTRPIVYAISEAPESQVHTLELTDEGLRLVASVPTGGVGACHLGFDETNGWVLVAHYSEGAVSSHRVLSDGTLSPAQALHPFTGSGPDQARQEQSHAHQIVPSEGRIKVPDLGADVVHRVRLDVEGRLTRSNEPIRLPAGSGPRHLVITRDHLVIACELSGDLWLARRNGEGWDLVHQVAASASDERVHPSALRIDGDQVFVANRGSDTFAVFSLDRQANTLTRRAEVATGGEWPRDLVLTEDEVWIANQASNNVSVFRRVPARESSSAEWVLDIELPVPSPACILLVHGRK
ncbi:lactonase family protein [Enemella sp. A6]|uniref:lactonase family protein n=1 Tax=Enemella sp. A6 TaxID=3440152 RepID=UPI003EBF9893